MSTRLITIQEVAERLRCTPRHVRNLPITIVRLDRRRLYDPRDVDAYIQASKCLSSKDQLRRTGGRSSSSEGAGLSEALARHPEERPRHSSANSEARLSGTPRHGARRRPRLIKPAAGTGPSTAGGDEREDVSCGMKAYLVRITDDAGTVVYEDEDWPETTQKARR